ncbi:sigma-70 family RNA polymerase sigma factor [Cytobacillus horneckiae]|uniref:sigma-70 family RNA polymerase sigma factor n=1 Tax=Cytobacillus horneckiae TaxID=549687 RepID=UPI003D9A40FA
MKEAASIEQIELLLRDYHWMKKEVDRLENILYGRSSPMRSWGVAQYGIEAAMPKGSSGKSQAELMNMDIREERLYKRLEKLKERVYAIEYAAELLGNERDRVIYDCIIDGMSFREISYHIGISRNQVKKAKETILNQLSQKSQFVHLLNLEKSA